jgi:hypothetical protein
VNLFCHDVQAMCLENDTLSTRQDNLLGGDQSSVMVWFGLVYGKNQSPRFTDKNDCSHSTSEKCHGHADTCSQNKHNIYGYTDSKGLKITCQNI